MQENYNNKDFFDQPLKIERFFNAIKLNTYRILFALFLGICLWAYYYYTVDRTYGVKAMIQVKESTSSTMSVEDLMVGGNDRVNLNEEINIFLSNSSIKKLINRLQINLLVNEENYQFDKSGLIDIPHLKIYDSNFMTSASISTSDSFLYQNLIETIFKITKNEGGYSILLDGEEYDNLNFNETHFFEKFAIRISHINGINVGENIKITHHPEDYYIDKIKGMIKINPVIVTNLSWNQGSLLNIFIQNSNVEFAKRLIDNACLLYIENSIAYNVAEAEKSLDYLNLQITRVEEDLRLSEIDLNNFQSNNSTINFDLEVQSIINQSNNLTSQIIQLESKKAELSSLYLPSNNIIKNVDFQINELNNQLIDLDKKIKQLPKKQQEFLQLTREVTLNKDIFEKLLEKRIEFSLIEASTIGNARVIDKAFVTGKMSPRLFNSFIIAIILSLALSITIIVIHTYFFDRISLPSEIQSYDNSLSILGMIPDFSNHKPKIISDFNNDSMQSIATNINIIASQSDKKNTCIEVISATESVGKSSVSMMIANNLSLLSKKVLLIDLDLYKGRLGKFVDQTTSISEGEFTSTENFEKYKVNDFLYFTPRVKIDPNKTLPFLESPYFNDFISRAKNNFDYIVIDTPPILYKSDGISLAKYSDIILPIFRQNVSRLIHIKQLKDIMKLSNISFQYIIFNGIKKLSAYYYSDYDYSSYKYYASDYSYEETDDK